jgi:ParB family transcriptional regulator, chromosome partitioning protein
MLGKGLESLIPPQKGNQQNNDANKPPASVPAVSPQTQPVQSAQPAQQPAQPASIQPQPQIQPQPVQQIQQQPAAQPTQRPSEQRPAEPRPQQKKDELAQESIFHIEVERIKSNPDQPRRNFNQEALNELANSIREFGFLQPIVVSKVEKETPTGIGVEYQIIAGERRFLAAKILGLPMVPVIVRNVNLEREKLELAVIENIQRENLNPIETARAFQRLQEEFRMTQREIAVKLGKSREVVANTMRLLDLPEYVRLALQEGKLSESHARLLIGVEDPGAQRLLYDDIIQNKLTTRDVKDRMQHMTGAHGGGHGDGPFGSRRGRPPLEEVHLAPEVRALQEELSSSLGTPVEIKKGGNTGRITISFYSEEELENILRRLGKERGV